MPTAQFSGAVVSYNASSRKVTAKDFIQDNLLAVSLMAAMVFRQVPEAHHPVLGLLQEPVPVHVFRK